MNIEERVAMLEEKIYGNHHPDWDSELAGIKTTKTIDANPYAEVDLAAVAREAGELAGGGTYHKRWDIPIPGGNCIFEVFHTGDTNLLESLGTTLEEFHNDFSYQMFDAIDEAIEMYEDMLDTQRLMIKRWRKSG